MGAMGGLSALALGREQLAGHSHPAESDRPNIVFLLTDDQRWDTLGCMGNPIIRTPNVDRLAEGGIVFDNCFVTTSICMTNRACIFTGQYAARHGVISFQTDFTEAQLQQTYPGQLKQAGYYLGFIGKWGVGQPPKGLFDYDKGWPGQNEYFHQIGPRRRHLTGMMSDQAMEFLDGLPADRPFCLSISFKAPHVQDNHPRQFLYDPELESLYADVTIPPPAPEAAAVFDALPEFLKTSENRVRWDRRFSTPEQYQEMVKGYYRLISGVDGVVGRIVDKLRRLKLDQNTIIIYTGDNGFYLGERGFAGKWYPHEVSIRVPLIVYDPRLPADRRGKRCDQMVLSIDLAPTVLAMAGVKIPDRMQGRSLVPLVQGEQPPWRTEFFYEHLFRHPRIPCSEGVRDGQFKYIRFIDPSIDTLIDTDPIYEELYDLAADPHEAHNLADQAEHAATLQRMRDQWKTLRQEAK
ncbi:MAG: hypothetical protein A2V70_06915 [Planctomycetes bacterium RBG_13_63_9]|nr:MAG: hypothetical protein A2V70_06915 [Planctomycetes bacterium RBG_13_63_9]